jgi:hypothetical protein
VGVGAGRSSSVTPTFSVLVLKLVTVELVHDDSVPLLSQPTTIAVVPEVSRFVNLLEQATFVAVREAPNPSTHEVAFGLVKELSAG